MSRALFFLLFSLLFISGCTNQLQLSTSDSYHGAPYSLESIAYEYHQHKVSNE